MTTPRATLCARKSRPGVGIKPEVRFAHNYSVVVFPYFSLFDNFRFLFVVLADGYVGRLSRPVDDRELIETALVE